MTPPRPTKEPSFSWFPTIPESYSKARERTDAAREILSALMTTHSIPPVKIAQHEVRMVEDRHLSAEGLIGAKGFGSLSSQALGLDKISRAGKVMKSFLRWRAREQAKKVAAEGGES